LGKIHLTRNSKDKTQRMDTRSTASTDSDDEFDDRLVLLDKPIEIGMGTWHVLNAYQLSKIGLDDQQIELIFEKQAKVTDFIADPQSAADRAFSDTK
jgi:hypothetical protein